MIDYQKLPTIELGDTEPEKKQRIEESFLSDDHLAEIDVASKHLPYKDAINHIHRSIESHLYTPEAKDVNKVVRDTLSKGLTVENYENAHSAINKVNHKDRPTLRKAWSIPLEHHVDNLKTDMHGMEREEQRTLSQEEFRTMKSAGFVPVSTKMIKSEHSTVRYHFEPETGEVGFHTVSFKTHRLTPSYTRDYPGRMRGEQTVDDHEEHHFDSQNDLSHRDREVIKKYTAHSQGFNKLHAIHHNEEWDTADPLHFTKEDLENTPKDSVDLTAAIRKIKPLPREFHTYAAVSSRSILDKDDPRAKMDEHGNMLYHAPAFSSTALMPTETHTFLRTKRVPEDGEVHDILKIKIPRNYPHGAFIQPHSDNPTETEYLLNKGHTFKVNPTPRYTASDGKVHRIFDAEIVNQSEEPTGDNTPRIPEEFKRRST